MIITPNCSIIIPTYNRGKIIGRAIKSILLQTYKNWEVIIVDDASTDETGKIIKITFSDERIKYFRLPVNKGNAAARNMGIKNARGNFITFLDSDDEFKPNFLEEFLKVAQRNSDFQFGFCGYSIFHQEKGWEKKFIWKPSPNTSFLEDLRIGIGCGVFVRKECFDTVGFFDENLRVAVDTDWLIRLDKEYNYTIVEDVLVRVYTHSGERVRDNKNELLKSYEIIYEKNKAEIEIKKELEQKFFYKLQWLNYYSNKRKMGNQFFYKQLAKNNLTLKALVVYFFYNIFPLPLSKKIHSSLAKTSNE